jgi:hypothetical protein
MAGRRVFSMRAGMEAWEKSNEGKPPAAADGEGEREGKASAPFAFGLGTREAGCLGKALHSLHRPGPLLRVGLAGMVVSPSG